MRVCRSVGLCRFQAKEQRRESERASLTFPIRLVDGIKFEILKRAAGRLVLEMRAREPDGPVKGSEWLEVSWSWTVLRTKRREENWKPIY